MGQLKPWLSWELLSSVAAMIGSLGVFHILATSVVILKGINHISIPYTEIVGLQTTKIPCHSLLPAKPPDITDKCDLLFWKKQAATIQSSPNLVVEKFKQPFQMLKSLSFELLHWTNIRLLDLECSACCTRSSQQFFEWHIPWDSCSASGHGKFSFAVLSSWDIDSTIDGVLEIKHISEVFILWDPGGPAPVLDVALLLHLTWDPSGYTQHRLEGKPHFKEGGLSATALLGWPVGQHSWAMACSRARQGGDGEAYIPRGQPRETGLGTEGRNGGFGRDLAWPVRVVCVARFIFFLLDPHLSPMFLWNPSL
jgi:hypothetical protein